MERDPKDLISIDAPKTDFEKFLTEDNKRIFFSGPFGIGKTFFLQKFFEQHTSEYDVYHLFPVNYQISSNENIVEFLKYDILVELLNKYPDAFEAENVKGVKGNFKIFAAFYKDRGLGKRLLKSALDIGMSTLSLSPDPLSQVLSRLGRPLGELVGSLKDYENFKQDYLSGDGKAIDKFLDDTGDIMATDHISHLLREKIRLLKIDGEKKRRSVLILDDFDRIDPEHTFRILNVLSTHMEGDEENRFGFDHIIIVGYLENLQRIFHHKYGAETDFLGYLDKFFTIEPYHFDNAQAIAERIPQLLRSIQYEDKDLERAMEDDRTIKRLLEKVLLQALSAKVMNLRQLYRPIKYPFLELKKTMFSKSMINENIDLCVDIGIRLLIGIYGNAEIFLKSLETIRSNISGYSSRENTRRYMQWSNLMLKRMVPVHDVGNKLWLDEYKLVMTNIGLDNSNRNIVLESQANESELQVRFFFHTLHEYVRRSEYNFPLIDD